MCVCVCTCAGAVPYEPADARLTHNSGTHGAQHTLLPRHRWLGAFRECVCEDIKMIKELQYDTTKQSRHFVFYCRLCSSVSSMEISL